MRNLRGFLKYLIISALIIIAAWSQKSNTVAFAETPPTLKIVLPPSEILTPTALRIAGRNFTFANNAFSPTLSNGISVSTTEVASPRKHFEITISGFVKGSGGGTARNSTLQQLASSVSNINSAKAYSPPPAGLHVCLFTPIKCTGGVEPPEPYEYKMTFASTTKAKATALAQQLGAIYEDGSYVGDENCNVKATGDHLCVTTIITLTTPDIASSSDVTKRQLLRQAIPISKPGQISVEGNVAGSGTISGFNFDDKSTKAIAVGGNIIGVSGGAGNNPTSYLANATVLKWSSVEPQITNLVTKNSGKATLLNTTTVGGVANLNSTGNNFNAFASSLSSPPEGKLWKTSGNTTFNSVNFSGSGTIIVPGNLVINNSLGCSSTTRLGIIATGTITFNIANSGNIDCGAFVAMGGNIDFAGTLNNTNHAYKAKGIFVASGNVLLPKLANEVSFSVLYDSVFASNPTILFKELLSVVFTTTS